MPDKKSLLDSLPVLDSTDNKTSGANSLLDNLPTIDDNQNTIPTKRSAQTAANGVDGDVAVSNLDFATDIMNRIPSTRPSEASMAQPNVVKLEGVSKNDNGNLVKETHTYADIPSQKGIIRDVHKQEGPDNETNLNKLSKPGTVEYKPQLGEQLRAALTQADIQKAQQHVGDEIAANVDYVTKDATNLINSAPEIIKDQLKGMGITSEFPKRLADVNGDLEAVNIFTKAKDAELKNNKANDLALLETQYPLQATNNRNEFAPAVVRENEQQYNQARDAIEKKYNEQADHVNSAAFNVAAIKSFNQEVAGGNDPSEVSPLAMGANIRYALGEKLERGLVDDKDIDPSVKVNTELLGYRALDIMAKKAFADKDYALYDALNAKTDNAIQKVIDDNPRYRTQQVEKAISDEIFADGQNMMDYIHGKVVTKEDVDAAGSKLGLRPQDYADINPDNIKRYSGPLNEIANTFLRTVLGQTAEPLGRHVLNPIAKLLGGGYNERQLNEMYKDNWYDNSAIGRTFGGASPDNDGIISSQTKVEANPASPDYLSTVNISDKNSSKYNLGLAPILSTIANGTGQMLGQAALGELGGAAFKGAGVVKDIDKARRIGTNVSMWITGWDPSVKQARQTLGENASEGDVLGLATIYNAAQVIPENIVMPYQLTDKILGTKAVGNFINQIEKDGAKAITKDGIKTAFKDGFLEAGKNIIGEGAEESATDYGNAIGDFIYAPDKFKQTDYTQQAIQDGIVGAVSAFLPVGAGSVREIAEHGPMAKSMLYEVGNNSQYYADQFQQQIDNGNLSQEEGNHKISMVHTMADIVKNSVPEVSVANNQDLTPKQQHDYANLRLQEEILKSRREKVKDPVQEQYIDKQLANIDVQKDGILQTAGAATQDNSSSINTSNNGQNNEAQEAGRQEGQNVLESQQTNKQSSGAEQSVPTAITPAAPIDDLLGQLEDETTTTNTPQNTVTDATNNIAEQQPRESVAEISTGAIATPSETTGNTATANAATAPIQEQPSVTAPTSTQTSAVESMRPTAVDNGKKVDYTTDNGNQRVVYQNGGLKVLNAKGEEVSAPTKRKAIREAADKYDFTTGEVAPPLPENVTTDEEYGKHIATTSNSPAELVNLYQTQEPIPQALSSIEQAIAEMGQFTTTNKSFDRFGDRNNKGRGIGLNYLNNTKGTPIDEIAREISDNTGLDVQPQDIVDFMQRFPQGVQQAQRTQPTQTAIDAQARFEQLTGFPLTKDIAEKVMAQWEDKLNTQLREETDRVMQNDFENEQQLTAEFERLLSTGEIRLEEAIPDNVSETNSKNELVNQENEPGSQQPGQEPITSPTAEALSPEEDKMRTMLNTIEDLKSKIEKSDAAREQLRKEGKENTDAYKVKVGAYQQLKAKLRNAEKDYRLASAKIYADKIRSKKVAEGSTMSDFSDRNLIYNDINYKLNNDDSEDPIRRDDRRGYVPTPRGAENVIKNLRDAVEREDIDKEGADLAIDLVSSNPKIFDELALHVSEDIGGRTQGYYESANTFIKIFALTDPHVATHELLHHTERYLPKDIRSGIINEWHKNLTNEKNKFYKKAQNEKSPTYENDFNTYKYLTLAEQAQTASSEEENQKMYQMMMETLRKIQNKGKYYQFFNPSEWWAGNAEHQFKQRYDAKSKDTSWIYKAKLWYAKLLRSAQNILGINRTAAITKGLDAIMNGNTYDTATGKQFGASGRLYQLSHDVGLNSKIYNSALEKAAQEIEAGKDIRNATQTAVDYINERIHTKWDEQKFRKNVLNEDAAFPFTPEELRQQKLNETELSDKNRQIADALVDKVKNNEATLDEVLDKINTTSLSPAVKEKISQYLRKSTTENVFKLEGKDMADKYLADYNNDFNAAREEMGKAYDTTLLSAQNETEKDNARKTFVAATAYLNAKETEQKVKDGDIKPTSILPENNVPKNLFALPKLTKIREAEYKFANRFARIRDAQKAAQDITKETDALSAYRLAKPRAWDKVNEIRQWLGSSDTVKGSLFDRMKKADVDLHKFNLFLYAQHAEERNAQNAKSRQSAFESKVYDLQTKIADAKSDTSRLNYQSQLDDILQQKNPDFVLMPDGGSGMTNQEAQEILQEVDKDGNTEKYQKFADEFREHVVQPILDFKYDSGLIDEEQYNRIRSAYQNYVPLKFDIEEAKRLADGTDGRTPEERAEDTKLQTERKKGKDLYKSSGAAEIKWGNRNSPVLQALSDLEHSILQGENNLANIRMANLVRENPNSDIWDVKPARYNITTDKDGNVTYTEEINPPKDAVPFWEDGKKSYLVFNDKGLKAAFEKAPDPNALLRLGSALSTLYRTGATLRNPDFIVKNVLIDQQDASAAISAEQNKGLTKNLKKNRGIFGANLFKEALPQLIKDEGRWAEARREWSKNGGKVSFTKPLSLQEEAQQANKIYEAYGSNVSPHQLKKYIKSPLTALENFSEFLEEITRIMVYKSARESGIDEEKSALLSRDATIDFEKSGTKGAYLNAFKVFMNAALQGTINDATRFKKSDAFRKWAGGMALAGAGMGALNSLLSDCDPPDNPNCYDELPEYKKQRSFIVPMKAFGGKGFLTIPMGRQLGIFGYIGQLAQSTSEYYTSNGEHGLSPAEAFKNLTEATANAYIPGGGQPIMQSLAGNFGFLVGLKTNENSFGSRIHPDNFKNVPEHENAFRNTPEFWKGLSSEISKLGGGGPGKNAASEAFEISPNTLQYIAQSLLTGYYSTGAKIANTAKAITSDEPLKSKDIPVVGSFVARESNMSLTKDRKANLVDKSKKQILTDKEMDQLKGYLKDLKEGGQDPTGKATSGTMRFVMKSQQQVKKHEKEGAKSEE